MSNLLCKLLDHKWIYSKTSMNTLRYYRSCERCGTIDEYRENIPAFSSSWFRLVQFTKKGAKDLLTKLERRRT